METTPSGPQPSTQDPNATLVTRIRKNSPDAGALLDDLYREALVRFCWGYLGRLEEAEDAAQDICFRALTADRIPDAFRPWLYKCARNHCLNLLRGRGRRRDRGELTAASQIPEQGTGQLTRLVRTEQASQLGEMVRRLPDGQREVLRLRYVEGLSRGEISIVLDTAESIIKSRLYEGLRTLRDAASSLRDSSG